MMLFPTLLSIVTFYFTLLIFHFASLSTARPSLQRRGLPGAVYICTEGNFRGDCSWIQPTSSCHIAGTGMNAPKSIGPDPGGFCVLYSKADCSGNQIRTIRFPGIDSAIPEFAGLKCSKDENSNSSSSTGIVQNGGLAGSGILSATDADPDARLAGGFGSMDRKKHKEVMEAFEEDNFSQGMIGLKKGMYY